MADLGSDEYKNEGVEVLSDTLDSSSSEDFAATSAVPPTVAEDNRCAVEECIESLIAGVFCTDANCADRHFCDLHLCHNSHSNHRLRVSQVSIIIN